MSRAAATSLPRRSRSWTRRKRDFINAVLRRESGASISPAEFENAKQQYFPQPGEPATVVEQKRAARETVLNGFRREAGPTYKPPEGDNGGSAMSSADALKAARAKLGANASDDDVVNEAIRLRGGS
jgi:hypothetical protein